MNKDSVQKGTVTNANDGRLSHVETKVDNTTMPKGTNSESHKGHNDIVSAPVNSLSPESHGKQGSNSHKL